VCKIDSLLKGNQITWIRYRPYHSAFLIYQQKRQALYVGKLSPFSNFYTMGHPFALNGITYRCVEQCYQYAKATLADDDLAAMTIMTESDHAVMKRISDMVNLNRSLA